MVVPGEDRLGMAMHVCPPAQGMRTNALLMQVANEPSTQAFSPLEQGESGVRDANCAFCC